MSRDAKRWQEVESIFNSAWSMDPAERSAYLDRRCAADASLRREVEDLLARDVPTDALPILPVFRSTGADPPERIGSYLIEEELGRGGMGVVYRARDLKLDRLVAVKVLNPAFARSKRRLERFLEEARVLAALNHPNISAIHHVEEAGDGVQVIVMELVPGESLADRVRRGPLPVLLALRTSAEIAGALSSAHERGIVHCDLKPANVRLTPDGHAKVLDFGLAVRLGREPETADREEPLLGTPGYMSPERLASAKPDVRADVFAFGCVLLECLTGAPAFPGTTTTERAEAARRREPSWSSLPAAPAGVSAILRRCLEKDPARRLGSMAEVLAQLEDAIRILEGKEQRAQVPNNLWRPLGRFIGRSREIADCRSWMNDERLVSLCGPAGGGKTRLALEIAWSAFDEHPGGVWFVDLSSADGHERVPRAVMMALGLRERPGHEPVEIIVEALSSNPTLIVLDNCEHQREATSLLAGALLHASERVRILATSREPLGVPGERVFTVPPLSTPPARTIQDPQPLLEFDAVRLFVDRAAAAYPGFELGETNREAVAEICRQLDGIPLALELAASRTRSLSVAEIAARLDDRFRLLRREAPVAIPRHQTLAAAIDWSYNHLTDEDQRFLQGLSAFAGSWTLQAAAAVAAQPSVPPGETELRSLELISNLVDKSLVMRAGEQMGESRYRLLETIRRYAEQKLSESGSGLHEVRSRHRAYFLADSIQAERELRGPKQRRWLERVGRQHDDYLRAMDCAASLSDEQAWLQSATICRALTWYWLVRGDLSLGRARIRDLLDRGGADDSELRAALLDRAGLIARSLGEYEESVRSHEEALRIFRNIGSGAGTANVLGNLGNLATEQGRIGDAERYFEEALARHEGLGRPRGVAINSGNLGVIRMDSGDSSSARPLLQRSLAAFRDLGDQHGVAAMLNNLGLLELASARTETARAHFVESASIYRALEEKVDRVAALSMLAIIDARDRPSESHAALTEALELSLDHPNVRTGLYALEACTELAERLGEPRRGATFLVAIRSLRTSLGCPPSRRERVAEKEISARLDVALRGAGPSATPSPSGPLTLAGVLRDAAAWLAAVRPPSSGRT